jgi:glycosyltransferase involved in cell wall biosynthesis
MKPCDVYIALGAIYKKSFISAKRKYKATTILEWGSKHIIDQQVAITKNTSVKKQKKYFIDRSLIGYQIADYISIPSSHVKDSFIINGIESSKLLVNPYGVDLTMFPPTKLDENIVYDVVMVGNWSYTKGCDLLIEFFKNHNYTFLHVGSIKNLHFPNIKNMTHIDHVDQAELKNYYSKARVFVLPSRTEGLALVQCQALACGLPIVCSKDTGGRDLRELLQNKEWIIEMDDFSIKALKESIEKALKLTETQKGIRDYAGKAIENLTWNAYGVRYDNILLDLKK